MAIRCEGWRRYGGAFTLGPVKWEQCENDAIVSVTVIQKGKKETLPGCMTCWEEAIKNPNIEVVGAVPLQAEETTKESTNG